MFLIGLPDELYLDEEEVVYLGLGQNSLDDLVLPAVGVELGEETVVEGVVSEETELEVYFLDVLDGVHDDLAGHLE